MYLQGGRASPFDDEHVISQEWIDASLSYQDAVGEDPNTDPFSDLGGPYGYLWWGLYGGRVYCAIGLNNYFVCIDRDLGRVVVEQLDGPTATRANRRRVVDLVFENPLYFHATNSGLSGMTSTVRSVATLKLLGIVSCWIIINIAYNGLF